MYCTHCGTKVGKEAGFCQDCGGRQPSAPAQRKLMRSLKGRKIGGVCMGVAEYLDVVPSLVRVVWVLCSLLPPSPGVIAYLVCWAVFPTEEILVNAPAPQPQAQDAAGPVS